MAPAYPGTWSRPALLSCSGRAGLVLVAALLLLPGLARAQEAWLVTYGPGEEVWELFGHNALWLRDPGTGLDHTYSFGYFEIDRAGFHLDFARGIMNYYGASSPAEREFAFYRQRQRSITAQRLALEPAQVRELQRALHAAIHPHPQFYAYDYFRANCSTWLRDLINQVSDDRLRPVLQDTPARLNFRDHTRRMTFHRPWIHTGILLLMGPSIDQSISAWDEAFLPQALARWLEEAEFEGGALVEETRVLHDPERFQPPHHPRSPWALLAAVGLAGGLLVVLSARARGPMAAWPWRTGAGLAGLAGLVVLLMWMFSEHADVAGNAVVLLLHPLWWLLLLPQARPWRAHLAAAFMTLALAGAVILGWPGLYQDRAALLVLLLPVLGGVAWAAAFSPESRRLHAD